MKKRIGLFSALSMFILLSGCGATRTTQLTQALLLKVRSLLLQVLNQWRL